MPYKDQTRADAYKKAWYEARRGQPHRMSQKRAIILAMIEDAKSVPCMDCGIQYPLPVMELDHRPGEAKVASVSDLARKTTDIELVRIEIAKCDTVCANCHRLRTARRAGWIPDVAA